MPGQWGMDSSAAFTYTTCVFSTLKTKKISYLKDISRRSTEINLYCQLSPSALSKSSALALPSAFLSAAAQRWQGPCPGAEPPSRASHLLAARVPRGAALPDHALLALRRVTGSRFRQHVTDKLAGGFHSNSHLTQQRGEGSAWPHPWGWARQVWKGCRSPAGTPPPHLPSCLLQAVPPLLLPSAIPLAPTSGWRQPHRHWV